MAWFIVFWMLASQHSGPPRPAPPPPDPTAEMWTGIGMGIVAAIMLAPHAYRAGHRLADLAWDRWTSLTRDAKVKGE